ncbi:uncharacterized protein LOC127810433 isoform X2 [Diospyros lotus]|uniref:uncharacterized protein LOC127810433 isoform X2 n=1 Tax=Diospyros lotus TaxID=55363 RepID=UPI00225A77E4|nr:uncharacterized protein LOC127810433 isoform X2 [Diospyros lotus]
MLEEYCNAHETVRAAMSAASLMKRQVDELKDALCKTSLKIVQMEWMHDVTPKPFHNVRSGADGRTWQQDYLNALTRLDVTYHSFTRTEQEWKAAQSNMEAASNGLFSAPNELYIASVKAKSA